MNVKNFRGTLERDMLLELDRRKHGQRRRAARSVGNIPLVLIRADIGGQSTRMYFFEIGGDVRCRRLLGRHSGESSGLFPEDHPLVVPEKVTKSNRFRAISFLSEQPRPTVNTYRCRL